MPILDYHTPERTMKKKAPTKRPDAKQRANTLPLKKNQAASVKGGTLHCTSGEHYKKVTITS
jgi:hypothetical protein